APAVIYTLSLHDALPICGPAERSRHWVIFAEQPRAIFRERRRSCPRGRGRSCPRGRGFELVCAALVSCSLDPTSCCARLLRGTTDRKSTRLNSSHVKSSY